MTDAPTPVIFIHGLWLHPLSGTEWSGLFEAAGYRAMAPGWPGVPDTMEAARANPDSIANHGIEDVTSHYAAIINGLPAKPILIGHSFGGMIAEKLLGQDLAAQVHAQAVPPLPRGQRPDRVPRPRALADHRPRLARRRRRVPGVAR
jgi:pimeloyl-ACP methyl ester carboxylesterase